MNPSILNPQSSIVPRPSSLVPRLSSLVSRPSSLVSRPSSLPGRSRFRLVCLLSSLVPLLLFAGGCQRLNAVDPNYVKAMAQEVNDLVVRVDAYQQAATVAIEQLVIQNAIDPNKASKILAANADVDRLQATIQQVTAALQSADYSDSRGLLTLIQSARAANAATAPWNPYAPLIAAALTILSTVLGIAYKKKTAEAAALGLKYQAHKQGVEKTMKQASLSVIPDVNQFETVLYDNIGAARSALGVT